MSKRLILENGKCKDRIRGRTAPIRSLPRSAPRRYRSRFGLPANGTITAPHSPRLGPGAARTIRNRDSPTRPIHFSPSPPLPCTPAPVNSRILGSSGFTREPGPSFWGGAFHFAAERPPAELDALTYIRGLGHFFFGSRASFLLRDHDPGFPNDRASALQGSWETSFDKGPQQSGYVRVLRLHATMICLRYLWPSH